MAKHFKDPGLEYMVSLNIKPAKSDFDFEDAVRTVVGRSKAEELFKLIDKRADGDSNNSEFYSSKTSSGTKNK